MKIFGKELKFNNNKVYHAGDKPTPSEIGAAAASHGTHVTWATTAPKANGTAAVGTVARVAREDHVHPLQTTVSGNAGTATKLQTARTITLKGNANGSVSFDGSGNVTISTHPRIFAGAGTSGTSGYVAFAQIVVTAAYANRPIEFKLISRGRATAGTVSLMFASVNGTDPALSSLRYWGSDYGVFAHKTGTSTWLLYCTKSEAYDEITLVGHDYGSQGVTVTYPGSFITTKPTSNVTNATLGGNFGHANTANSATKSTQDSAGQQINTTYIKGLSVSGKTITYTKGDGTTGTITTQDTNTTYSVGTASALGLTKLYTGTGTATDGTMTQSAINTALNGKAAASHTHSGYAAASHDHPTPASGSYWNNGYLKVNGDGVVEGGKYFDFHNTNATTSDYSTRLMCTGDTKNEVQLPSGSGTIGLMRHANDYWGLVPPDGNGDNWIRTTTSGLIPHQSGVASNIGTESWRFANGYFGYLDASGMIRARDRFEVANIDGTAQFGVGGSDSFWYNKAANKYVQFKNNGTLCISDSEFYHRGHNIIDVAHRSSGDSGFGDSSKPCGFIGRFPGWNSNCLYINTWSNNGSESASYGIVKIKGSQVQHDGFITIQGTPVSVQSSAPGVGGVWIQI